MVTTQNIVFDIPVRSCPTSDDIFVQIDISVVMQMQQENEYLYQLCLNVNDLN